jgi:AbrB family looped-hinge helix DNA binding protein
MDTTTVSTKGQIVLPAELRRQDRIRPGEQFEIERLEAGQYLLKKCTASGQTGVVQWLRACPEGDWFRPLPSESTDTV